MAEEMVRLVRVIEYQGPRSQIEALQDRLAERGPAQVTTHGVRRREADFGRPQPVGDIVDYGDFHSKMMMSLLESDAFEQVPERDRTVAASKWADMMWQHLQKLELTVIRA